MAEAHARVLDDASPVRANVVNLGSVQVNMPFDYTSSASCSCASQATDEVACCASQRCRTDGWSTLAAMGSLPRRHQTLTERIPRFRCWDHVTEARTERPLGFNRGRPCDPHSRRTTLAAAGPGIDRCTRRRPSSIVVVRFLGGTPLCVLPSLGWPAAVSNLWGRIRREVAPSAENAPPKSGHRTHTLRARRAAHGIKASLQARSCRGRAP